MDYFICIEAEQAWIELVYPHMLSVADAVLIGSVQIFWLHASPSDANVSLTVGASPLCVCLLPHFPRETDFFLCSLEEFINFSFEVDIPTLWAQLHSPFKM